jgi:NTP pyrophosphatase (non-canonical NTP hydrolase)
MNFHEYDKLVKGFRLPSANAEYIRLNLAGEVGEFLGKVAKAIRDGKQLDFRYEVMKEAGDILWQLNEACKDLDFTLEQAAQLNVDKLTSRARRNALNGSGDNR